MLILFLISVRVNKVVVAIKIPRLGELGRPLEVNLLNRAWAKKFSTHLSAVLVSLRTPQASCPMRRWNENMGIVPFFCPEALVGGGGGGVDCRGKRDSSPRPVNAVPVLSFPSFYLFGPYCLDVPPNCHYQHYSAYIVSKYDSEYLARTPIGYKEGRWLLCTVHIQVTEKYLQCWVWHCAVKLHFLHRVTADCETFFTRPSLLRGLVNEGALS